MKTKKKGKKMDLKEEKQKIVEMIQANQVDIAKVKQHGEELERGRIYLRGQLDLISTLISKETKPSENVPSNLQPVPPAAN